MKILVTGGAGYIGSHMVKLLLETGHSAVVLDNLSTGHRDAILDGELIEGDLSDRPLLNDVFSRNRFDGVMHFAAYVQVGESVEQPALYYGNNLANTVNLLQAMQAHGAGNLIFSSTAAVFGEPQKVPIDEQHPKNPINPYGASKAMVERILLDFDRAYGFRSVSLRYFNAAGADPSGLLGERYKPQIHLIPRLLECITAGIPVRVFGRDYDTPDGTCVRDYVHVIDICRAHFMALAYLHGGGPTAAFNLGNGDGFSVQQVIDAVRRVTRRPFEVQDAPRRAGDPARLVADTSRAGAVLGWIPQYRGLERMVEDAWRWECSRSHC